jgi:hypothetical protein
LQLCDFATSRLGKRQNNMNTQTSMEDRLWDYIDGSSSAEEKTFVEQLIATQESWRSKYSELLDIHQLMSNSLELDQPSMRFTQNVMEDIARYQITPAAKNYINKKIIYGIGAFFLALTVGFLIYGFAQINWSDAGTSNDLLSKYNPDKLDWSRFFNNSYTNVFMMITVITGLMLLDMYLGKKRKELKAKS